jgi:murein DD-endopeptidase MepM/ murein hydrolase activator NlpD
MKTNFILLLGIFYKLMFTNGLLLAQPESIEQVTLFGNRIKTPIVMDVKTDQGVITIDALNKSYYVYNFEISFGEFQNLSPRVFEKKTLLFPGINRLFSFKIVNPNEPPRISYKISYSLANSNGKIDPSFPYLIPISENKKVIFKSSVTNGVTTYYENQFVMNKGDTVFVSRKGVITALPNDEEGIERIINKTSLEIRHDDGSIAVYIGLEQGSNSIKLGQVVYPGQPLGLIGQPDLLIFGVYEIQANGHIKYLTINYSGTNEELISPGKLIGTTVVYSKSVIKKELTKRELAKFNKGTLY